MASPIPVHIILSPRASPPLPKRCPHQKLTLDTTAAGKMVADTPPMTPKSAGDSLFDSLCSCSLTMADDDYQLVQHVALTPPRTPKGERKSLSFCGSLPVKATVKSGPASNTASSSDFVLADSSTSSSAVSSFSSTEPCNEKPSTPTTGAASPAPPATIVPRGTFTLFNDSQPYGTGAWSVVQRALYTPDPTEGTKPEIIAVKKPAAKSAIPILRTEAAILSYLCTPTPTRGVIQFYGFGEATTSLLLPAYPLTLESLVKASNSSINSEENISLSTLRCPVVRMRQWLFLTKKLCEGFIELKNKRVVHGDVKWGNILLREYTIPPEEKTIWGTRKEEPLYEPIIIDFSSSHIVDHSISTKHTAPPISALTVAFCAPELLEAFLRPIETPVATYSSDLYSLALTLLTASIGSDPYSVRGASDARKSMWVKCGDPVGFARGDERGLRVARGGVVDSCLMGCFGKTDKGRVSVEAVWERVNGCIDRWNVEGGMMDDRWGC